MTKQDAKIDGPKPHETSPAGAGEVSGSPTVAPSVLDLFASSGPPLPPSTPLPSAEPPAAIVRLIESSDADMAALPVAKALPPVDPLPASAPLLTGEPKAPPQPSRKYPGEHRQKKPAAARAKTAETPARPKIDRQPKPPAQKPATEFHLPSPAQSDDGSAPINPASLVALIATDESHHSAKSDSPQDVSQAILSKSPPWLVSMLFHTGLLILLALIVVTVEMPQRIRLLSMPTDPELFAEDLGAQLEFDLDTLEDAPTEDPLLADNLLPEMEGPLLSPDDLLSELKDSLSPEDLTSPALGIALSGRQPGSKEGLLAKYGGTALTQEAVDRGLAWLVRQQREDGSWSLAGPYKDGVGAEYDNPAAATAMALLALLGDGQTHRRGKYKVAIDRGWRWLVAQQGADGCFFRYGPVRQRFYTHGQCTIAICELYAMTGEGELFAPARAAVDYIVKCQSPQGGWRYEPKFDSDVSVTGWIVIALKSAQMAGLDVPDETFDRVNTYLDDIAISGGSRYPYQRGERESRCMTAEAILMRQYLGWPRDEPAMIDAIQWITSPENAINFEDGRDCYYWYYATQATHHMGGEYWDRWNSVMRQILPERQETRGPENGSWDPNAPSFDQWSPSAGRLYVTCMSIYMLEVYYRHLPIYDNIYRDLKRWQR